MIYIYNLYIDIQTFTETGWKSKLFQVYSSTDELKIDNLIEYLNWKCNRIGFEKKLDIYNSPSAKFLDSLKTYEEVAAYNDHIQKLMENFNSTMETIFPLLVDRLSPEHAFRFVKRKISVDYELVIGDMSLFQKEKDIKHIIE
jgi:hypothetical protein